MLLHFLCLFSAVTGVRAQGGLGNVPGPTPTYTFANSAEQASFDSVNSRIFMSYMTVPGFPALISDAGSALATYWATQTGLPKDILTKDTLPHGLMDNWLETEKHAGEVIVSLLEEKQYMLPDAQSSYRSDLSYYYSLLGNAIIVTSGTSAETGWVGPGPKGNAAPGPTAEVGANSREKQVEWDDTGDEAEEEETRTQNAAATSGCELSFTAVLVVAGLVAVVSL